MFRTGTSGTYPCDCGVDRETAEHFFKSRNDILDQNKYYRSDPLKLQEVQKHPDYSESIYFNHLAIRSAQDRIERSRSFFFSFWPQLFVNCEPSIVIFTEKIHISEEFIHLGRPIGPTTSEYLLACRLVTFEPSWNWARIGQYRTTTTTTKMLVWRLWTFMKFGGIDR